MTVRSATATIPLLLAASAALLGACDTINGDNERLLLACPGGASTKDKEGGKDWQLLEGTVAGRTFRAVGAEITLAFHDARLFGHGGVNRYIAPVRVSGRDIVPTGAIVTTRMAGPRAAMRRESDYLAALGKVTRYRRSGEHLQLLGADGVVLRFQCPACNDR